MTSHVCADCFLVETTGRVCPTAREAYGLETPAYVLPRSEALRAAVAADAGTHRTLRDLVCLDAARLGSEASRNTLLLPSPAAAGQISNTDTQKEMTHVIAARTTG